MQRIIDNKKKVLLYLGKFPGYGCDIDGGSILARQLIDTLKTMCQLDVVFIRKNGETFKDDFVHNIKYVEYKDPTNNKFIRRLENLSTNREAIGDYSQYDIIITAHTSKFFGFDKSENDFWKKTVLFPMFCTPSYRKAGEEVPISYTNLEKIVISNVNKIIAPSYQEKALLINEYQCKESKVRIIYRGINPIFSMKVGGFVSRPIDIVYIGSIKPQKNNIESLKLLNLLNSQRKDFRLNIVCTIQNQNVFREMLLYIIENDLKNQVKFYMGINQKELAALLQTMDINISVSKWETFGRGIFEGIASGLPTFVLDRLTVVKEICKDNEGVCFATNIEQMAKDILSLFENEASYTSKKKALPIISARLSYVNERKELLKEILNG